jgi:hypothetical protein
MLGVHDVDPGRESSPRGLFVCGACHFVGQVDADNIARRADLFSGREQHGSATGRYVKHSLSGLEVSDGYESTTEICETPRARIVVGCDCVELVSGLSFSVCRIVVHVHPAVMAKVHCAKHRCYEPRHLDARLAPAPPEFFNIPG